MVRGKSGGVASRGRFWETDQDGLIGHEPGPLLPKTAGVKHGVVGDRIGISPAKMPVQEVFPTAVGLRQGDLRLLRGQSEPLGKIAFPGAMRSDNPQVDSGFLGQQKTRPTAQENHPAAGG